MVMKRPGQVHDTGPLITGVVDRRVDEVAPSGDTFHHGEQVPDLGGFERSSVDACLVEQESGLEEAAELEAAAARQHRLHFGCALLLLVDPGNVVAGLQCKYPSVAQWRRCAAGDVFAEARPLQGRRARFAQRRRDVRQ